MRLDRASVASTSTGHSQLDARTLFMTSTIARAPLLQRAATIATSFLLLVGASSSSPSASVCEGCDSTGVSTSNVVVRNLELSDVDGNKHTVQIALIASIKDFAQDCTASSTDCVLKQCWHGVNIGFTAHNPSGGSIADLLRDVEILFVSGGERLNGGEGKKIKDANPISIDGPRIWALCESTGSYTVTAQYTPVSLPNGWVAKWKNKDTGADASPPSMTVSAGCLACD